MKRIKNVDFHKQGGAAMEQLAKVPFDKIESTISEPTKWAKELPEGAREFITYTAGGQMRRPCLILKNADGIYDTVEEGRRPSLHHRWRRNGHRRSR